MGQRKNRESLDKAKKARVEVARAFEDLEINRTVIIKNIKQVTAQKRIVEHNKNFENKKKFSYILLEDGSLEIRRRQ